jgi:TetR/AcrR family transcriptional regulator, tetracycline repressor protein
LTEAAIVAAALQIIEERGVDGLTMRLLSERLGVALGATYRHVSNKHALLQLVGRELYSRVDEAAGNKREGLDRTRSLLIRFRDVVGHYPGMASYVADHLGEFGSPQLLKAITDALLATGLSSKGAARVTRTLFFYTAGAMLTSIPGESDQQASEYFAAGLDLVLQGVDAEVAKNRPREGSRSARGRPRRMD